MDCIVAEEFCQLSQSNRQRQEFCLPHTPHVLTAQIQMMVEGLAGTGVPSCCDCETLDMAQARVLLLEHASTCQQAKHSRAGTMHSP